MVWPLSGLLAHCQACGAASMGSGVLAGVDPQDAQWQDGQAQLTLPLVVCCRRHSGGEGEADLWEGWIHRSTTLGIWGVQASSVMETGSLWNFSWEREIALASAFVPC